MYCEISATKWPERSRTGEEAVRMAAEFKADLILMDINLAGEIDGREPAAQIGSRTHIPVVYFTACAEEDVSERTNRTEPSGHLRNPIERSLLRSTIETVLSKHGAEKRIRESEQLYHAAIDSMREGVVIQDSQHIIISYNPAAERILGVRTRKGCREVLL